MAIKPVSFKANEMHLLEYAEQHGGFSYYVKELIKRDMQGKQENTDNPAVSMEEIKKLLKMLEEQQKTDEAPNKIESKEVEAPLIDMGAVAGILNSLDRD